MERCSAALTGNSVERSDRLTKPRATDIASAAEIISRIGVLFMKGAQRELVNVNELIQEMIVLPRIQAALPLPTAAPRRLTQFFCRIAGLFTSESRLGLRGSSRRLLYAENRSLTYAYWVVLIAGMAIAQDNSSQHPSARQQLQHIHGPQSIDQALARLTKDLKLTPEQQKQVRPLLQEHHDRIQAMLDKNPTASRQELASQIHSISDETHHKIRALLTDHQKELEKAMQQREHNGQENRRPAPPAAASPEPPSSVRQN